jgi:serine/threonine protein phosphatase PrpC
VDLPGNAPTIGRASRPRLGVVKPGMRLRPPAVSLDGTTAGPFQIAAASFIGTGHLQSGVPRQDAYNFMPGRTGRLYVAIADGLGSKPASQLGAHLFAESVLFAAAEADEGEEAGPAAADLLRTASRRAAAMVTDAYGIDPRVAGFVGAVAVFSEDGCHLARVGDVSAFTLEKGEFTEAFEPDEGLVNIVSAAMPGEQESEVEVAALPPGAVVVLGTDGFANDLRNSGTLREWLAGQWQVPHLPFGFGDTLRYCRQGSHDDRTAVVVWRPAAGSSTGGPASTSCRAMR